MFLENGKAWLDTDGNVIHAHGGHMLYHGGFYYWYGEDRRDDLYVSCYRSRDLMSWEFRNHVLTMRSPTEPIRVRTSLTLVNKDPLPPPPPGAAPSGDFSERLARMQKVNIERPKVLYNELTGKFVMWMHYENGRDYRCAAAAIATCDTPDGDFVYHGSFNPYGQMSRDCTLFRDDDGTAYFISAARDNADTNVYRLSDDYMNVDAQVASLWQGEYREAAAVMRRGDGRYFMFSSFCTGWAPNQGKFGYADGIEGRWSNLRLFGDSTTFRSQPAFILPLRSGDRETFVYVGDRWGGKQYFDSSYIFLEIKFDGEGMPYITWNDKFALDAEGGRYIEM